MANKPLKSIKFPGLPDTYTIPQVDSAPTQGSTNAVSSGGVYTALHNTDTTLTQARQAADAKVVGDEIEGVKNNLSDLETGIGVVREESPNLFDKTKIESGKTFASDGSVIDGTSNDNISDYIPVDGLSGIVIGSYNAGVWTVLNTYIVAYDANKNKIGQRDATGGAAFVIASGVKYVRFRLSTSYINYIMAVSSDYTVTGYIEYFAPRTDYVSGITKLIENAVYIGANREYTSFTQGVLKALETKNTKVYVDPGIYDIEQEFKDLYGSTFFDNFDDNSMRGLFLGNGIELFLSPNTVLYFHYSGSNPTVKSKFSPLNFAPYNTYSSANYEINGFKIHGGVIDAKNCRYCVHDDPSSFDKPYTNVYDGVSMILDNTENTAWGAKACIGSGLGMYARFVVKNCIFESKGATNTTCSVSVHNSNRDGAKSKIEIFNNYLRGNNTIRLLWYGASDLLTAALVYGNSVGRNIELRANTEDSTIENIELLAWNNEVRTT